MIKLIIFDWDDVFTIGSKEGYFACYEQVLQKLKIPRNIKEERKRILSKWGGGHRETLTELLKEHLNLIDKACKIYEKNLFGDTYINPLSIPKGLQNLLKKLARSYTLALVTGVHPYNLKRVMRKFGIPNVFSQIITSYDLDDPHKAKPNPYMIQQIIKTQKINHSDVIFVGDAEGDVVMAKAAGVIPVVVLTGHLTTKEAKKLNVGYIIPDVTSLNEILHKLNSL